MPDVTLLIKPASGLCGLDCRYCFYKELLARRRTGNAGAMTLDTARILVQRAFRAARPRGQIRFFFQGGEPTLAGLDFFEGFLRLEREYAHPGVTVFHAIQTNGQALTEAWTDFFRREEFLVGLSLDGTQALHDRYRVTPRGEGSWAQAHAALQLLHRFQVETDLLCVVTGPAAKMPQRLYRSLTGLGPHGLQLIPCMDPIDAPWGRAAYSLSPQAYGRFLCGVFDAWFAHWKAGRYVSIRLFDDALRSLLRQAPLSCAHAGRCGDHLVVEGDGSLYPCDFYAQDRWYLGNIRDMDIAGALQSQTRRAFRALGDRRPERCAACRYGPLCRGGCRREWTQAGVSRFCEGYQAFFPYAIERLETVAACMDPRLPG